MSRWHTSHTSELPFEAAAADETMAELEKFNDELSALADLDLDFGSIDGVASDGAAADSGIDTSSSSSSSSSTAAGDDTAAAAAAAAVAAGSEGDAGASGAAGVAADDVDVDALMGDNALEDFGDFLDSLTAAGEES